MTKFPTKVFVLILVITGGGPQLALPSTGA